LTTVKKPTITAVPKIIVKKNSPICIKPDIPKGRIPGWTTVDMDSSKNLINSIPIKA
jgi:hypothetical protein